MWQGKRNEENEETRKVQFTGGSTYIISLPKKWIALNQLRKGSLIKLRSEEGGLLTIVPTGSLEKKKLDEVSITVNSKDDIEMVKRKIIAAYLRGYNSIYVKPDKGSQQLPLKQRQEIKGLARRMFVGTEIIKDSSSEISLQVLLSYPELTVQSALRRMAIIATSMHKDSISGLIKNDKLLAKEVMSTDNEVDRFNLYVIRLLRAAIQYPWKTKDIGLASANDCSGYRLVAISVEGVAEHAISIAGNVLSLKRELSAETAEKIENASNLAIKMFDNAMEALFRQDYHGAETIIESLKEANNLEDEAVTFSKVNVEDEATLRLIIESIRRTAGLACEIAEIVLNLTLDSILV